LCKIRPASMLTAIIDEMRVDRRTCSVRDSRGVQTLIESSRKIHSRTRDVRVFALHFRVHVAMEDAGGLSRL